MPWFVNEELGVYPFRSAEAQQEEYPNDFPNEFATEAEAEAWADEWEATHGCRECGEGDGQHDRCCTIGVEEEQRLFELAWGQE